MVSRKFLYTGESAIEGQRKAGSREEAHRALPGCTTLRTPRCRLIPQEQGALNARRDRGQRLASEPPGAIIAPGGFL